MPQGTHRFSVGSHDQPCASKCPISMGSMGATNEVLCAGRRHSIAYEGTSTSGPLGAAWLPYTQSRRVETTKLRFLHVSQPYQGHETRCLRSAVARTAHRHTTILDTATVGLVNGYRSCCVTFEARWPRTSPTTPA
jgi:hypothetical protein